MNQNDIAKKEKNTSSPEEKEQIAKKVKSNANIVGGVCAKDGDADGEKGGMVEGDQAVHNHLQGVVVLVGIGQRLRIFFLLFYCIFLTHNCNNLPPSCTYYFVTINYYYYLVRGHPSADR